MHTSEQYDLHGASPDLQNLEAARNAPWVRFLECLRIFANISFVGFHAPGSPEEEEEDYKLWPANKSDRSWQSLSNPAKRHSFVSN